MMGLSRIDSSSGLPTYEERWAGYDAVGYVVTNEEPEAYRLLLRNHLAPSPCRFARTAGIASGGEVIFTVLLPWTTGEVVAVDHSYRSVVACFIKAILLNTLGSVATKGLLAIGSHREMLAAAERAARLLPPALARHACLDQSDARCLISRSAVAHLHREWSQLDDDALTAAASRLDRLTLIHGDVTDLDGQFDVLYISNITEHRGRAGKYPNPREIANLVRSGGVILASDRSAIVRAVPRLKTAIGFRTNKEHSLFRAP